VRMHVCLASLFVVRRLRRPRLVIPAAVLAMCGFHPLSAAAASCESLTSLSLTDVTITSAQMVAAGAFTPPTPGRGGAAAASPFSNLPPFCRVQAAVKRSGDTDVTIEVWMPAASAGGFGGWNGDFQPAASGF